MRRGEIVTSVLYPAEIRLCRGGSWKQPLRVEPPPGPTVHNSEVGWVPCRQQRCRDGPLRLEAREIGKLCQTISHREALPNARCVTRFTTASGVRRRSSANDSVLIRFQNTRA